MNQQIKEQLLANRPNLSESSLKTYESNLRNMYLQVYPDDKTINLEKFDNVEDFVNYFNELVRIKKMTPSTRKGRYSALFVLTQLEQYNDLMMDDIDEYNKIKSTQEQTEKQKANSLTEDELDAKLEEMNPLIKGWFASKNLPKIQEYLILVLYGGYYLPPRRSADFVNFKLRNIDESTYNFMQLYTKDKKLHGRFVFNEFKTKQRGQNVIEIPTELVAFIRKWKRLHTSDYLFFNGQGQPISNVVLNQRIEKMFKKPVGINGFRHLYMTSKYAHMIEDEKKMSEDFAKMGSSIKQRNVYIQKRD